MSSDSAATIRVLLADDHPVVRSGLRALLESLEGIEVVAEAGTGREAVRETALVRPDVVIMDLRMPDLDGVEATRRIRAEYPAVAVLVLTMFDEDDLVGDAIAAGALGYLLKGAEPGDIERAVRGVAVGDAVFARDVAQRVLTGATRALAPAFATLTERERAVLELIATGLGNTAIADRLGIAVKTVGNHITAVFAKLGVATRAEAIVMARDAGLGRS